MQRTAADVEAVTGDPPPAAISDEVLADIDALQFVDSSPEALRKRLGHGNIYPPDRIEAALRAEFQPARLAALREIGLRLVGQTRARARRCSRGTAGCARRGLAARPGRVARPARRPARPPSRCALLRARAPAPGPAEPGGTARLSGSRRPPRPAAPRSCSGTAATRARRSSPPSRRLNARHLVLAVPTAGLLERWRGTLLERLAGQLPRVHLHIEAAAGSAEADTAEDRQCRGTPPPAVPPPRGDPGLPRLRARLRHDDGDARGSEPASLSRH